MQAQARQYSSKTEAEEQMETKLTDASDGPGFSVVVEDQSGGCGAQYVLSRPERVMYPTAFGLLMSPSPGSHGLLVSVQPSCALLRASQWQPNGEAFTTQHLT